MSAAGRRVVVANPSSNPEMAQAASGLAAAALLERYHVPVATTAAQEVALDRLPGVLRRPLLAELRRRRIPAGVPEDVVRRTAMAADFVRVAAQRLPLSPRSRTALTRRQDSRFDARVASTLQASDGCLLAVLGTVTGAVRRASAFGLPTILDVPIAHPAWLRSMMREEARLVPEYAATLQGHDLPDSRIAAHAEEYRLADVLLVLSSHERATLLEQGVDEAKMVLTPLGVDLDLFRPRPRAEDGAFRVLFVGQITQRKGISYLVEAFRRAAIPDSELMLVGAVIGSARPWRSTPGVRHVPPVPRSELPALYATADVYVLPSLAEGFPLTQMEAMAMGLPVVVSENTSARDVVTDGHDGWVVPIRDAATIAERLTELARDPGLRARMGAAARRRAEDFDWARYRERIVGLVRARLS